jgi:hypothetical protein
MLARILQGPARVLATIATVLSTLSTLLWLPISRGRLTLGTEVDDLIRMYQPGTRIDLVPGGGWAFWPYTGSALSSVAAAGAALTISGVRRKTGAGLVVVSVLTPVIVITQWRDWPPFVTYLFTALAGLSLIVQRANPKHGRC